MNKSIKNIVIDAKGRSIGRVASEVATLLTGKNEPDYQPNEIAKVEVILKNIDKIKISQKKLENSHQTWHTGYPGGLRQRTWMEIFKKNPQDLFMKVVYNMLPKNKHRSELVKKIKFE